MEIFYFLGRKRDILPKFHFILPKFHFTLPKFHFILPKNLGFPRVLFGKFFRGIDICRHGVSDFVASYQRFIVGFGRHLGYVMRSSDIYEIEYLCKLAEDSALSR